MELFDIVFNSQNIYDTIFFSIKSVTSHRSIHDLKEEKPELFEQWKLIAAVKYGVNENTVPDDAYLIMLDDVYKSKGMFYPEFSKIVGIVAATVEHKDGKFNRKFHRFMLDDEFKIISEFRNYLTLNSQDKNPILCGHNVINNDIPLFIKRLFYHRDKFSGEEKLLPQILRNHLRSKPWEANVVDTINLWKFNGVSNTPLPLISDFSGLKKNTELVQMDEMSNRYWTNIDENHDVTIKFIEVQAINQVNLIIQLLYQLRYL